MHTLYVYMIKKMWPTAINYTWGLARSAKRPPASQARPFGLNGRRHDRLHSRNKTLNAETIQESVHAQRGRGVVSRTLPRTPGLAHCDNITSGSYAAVLDALLRDTISEGVRPRNRLARNACTVRAIA